MYHNHRTVLEDAVTTCINFSETFTISDDKLREEEQREFIRRIKNDIVFVLNREP